MGQIFLDLREKEIFLYAVGKNGTAGMLKETFPLPSSGGYRFFPGGQFRTSDESCLSLPLDLLNFRIMEFPFSDVKRINEVLPFELDGIVLGGSERVVFNAYPLGESKGKYEVLVAYVMKDKLREILDDLKMSGFDPRVITSLELAHILSVSSKDKITGSIISPEPVTEQERLDTAVREMKNPTLDFRKGEFAYARDTEWTRRSMKMSTALIVLLLLVFLSRNVMTIFELDREDRLIKDEIRKTYLGLFPDEKRATDEVYQLRAHLKELKEKESSFAGISPLEILLDASRANMQNAALNEITIDSDYTVIKGECPAMSDVERIKKNLESFLNGVTISDAKTSPKNRILFTLTVRGRKI
jgi:type II secretory pathway component PulL